MSVHPQKRSHFSATIPGLAALDPDVLASVQIPNIVFEGAEHMEENFKVETPTNVNVEDFEITLFEDQNQHNNIFLNKIPFDQVTGGLKAPADFEFDMIVRHLAWDRITPRRKFTIKVCKIKNSRWEVNDRLSADNQLRTLLITCKKMIEEPV